MNYILVFCQIMKLNMITFTLQLKGILDFLKKTYSSQFIGLFQINFANGQCIVSKTLEFHWLFYYFPGNPDWEDKKNLDFGCCVDFFLEIHEKKIFLSKKPWKSRALFNKFNKIKCLEIQPPLWGRTKSFWNSLLRFVFNNHHLTIIQRKRKLQTLVLVRCLNFWQCFKTWLQLTAMAGF